MVKFCFVFILMAIMVPAFAQKDFEKYVSLEKWVELLEEEEKRAKENPYHKLSDFVNTDSLPTTVVKYKDESMLKKVGRNWMFKDSLPDGHYVCSYSNNGNVDFGIVITENGKKKVYYKNCSEHSVSFEDLFSYKNGELDGHFIMNWFDGSRRLEGYFTNGFKDSIWTYYYSTPKPKETGWLKEKQVEWKNGKEYLINYWDKEQNLLVKDGSGVVIKESDRKVSITPYKDGVIDGIKTEKYKNPERCINCFNNEMTYNNGLLTREVTFYDSSHIRSVSEWAYPDEPKVDTVQVWFDEPKNTFENIILYNYTSVPNGEWKYYHKNGQIAFQGQLHNGERVGEWLWYYKNGQVKQKVDYEKNRYKHYFSTRQKIQIV